MNDAGTMMDVVSGRIQDPVLIFALVMILILVAPLLFNRIRVPGIVGLIVAGMVVGPHGLGWFGLDQTFTLLGKVGLLYLMFLAGLEINLREFARQRRHSLTFGALTFLIPQIGGALAARWLFNFSWPTAILLASMFASHTLITYPLVVQLGLTRNRAVMTAIGGTILTDIAALMVLALIEQSTADSLSALFWARQILLLFVLVLGILWGLPKLGYWFFRRAQPDPVSEYLFIVATAFLCSYAASLAGVEPIIGAFLAGLALSQLVPESGVLMNRLHFMGHALFIPFFLLSVGMRVDLSILVRDPKVWSVALFMSAAVHLTKWLAAQGAGRLLGYSPAERGLIFGISVNQAAATLAAVIVGTRIGLFDDSILNGTILMILVSCVAGAWATDRYGRRVAIEQKRIVPTRTTEERILIPLGNRMNAGPLMDFALLLRDQHVHVPLYPLNVALDGPHADALVAQGESLLEDAVMRAVAADTPVEPLTRIDTNRAGGILRAIREKRISCVILGWRGKATGMGRFFRDVLDQVLDRTGTSLFVTRLPQPLNATRRMRLLLPPMIHHQPGFRETVRRCVRLSKQMGAPLLIMGAADALRALPKPGAGAAKAAWDTHELADWSQWPATLAALTEPEDFLVMISARRGRLPWHPGLARNLHRLHTDYPDHNLLVIYPSELGVTEDEEQEVEPVGADPAVQQAVLVASDTPLDAPLQELLTRMVPDPTGAAQLAQELGQTEPVALAEGVALLHTHTPHVEGTRIGLVLSQGGANFTGDHAPFFLVFVLISEQGLSPQEHLRALAGIARMARDKEELERLRNAKSEEQCCRVLS